MKKRGSNLPQQSTDNNLIDADGELKRSVCVPMVDDLSGTYDKKQDRF